MWTRKELKEQGKAAFKANYWKSVIVAFILSLLIGGGAGASSFSNGANLTYKPTSESATIDTEDFDELNLELNGEEVTIEAPEDMVDALDTLDDTGHLMAAAVVGMIVFFVVFIVILAVVLALNAFVINPVCVGGSRFFVKNLDEAANASNLGYGFDNNYKNIVITMILRDIYTILWGLLFIIPGIVKAYEYRMIPYLLAEDPTMTREQAFAISKEMMTGNKWKAFVLDLSFLGWHILGLFTLGILEIFYVQPYEMSTDAALYRRLLMDRTPAQESVPASDVYTQEN